MVEKGMSCIKYMLFAFNLLFFIFGAVLIGVGAYAQIANTDYAHFSEASLTATAVLLIIVGVITLVVAFFGCCGAIKENHCMTMTFAVLVGIILVCEIAGGIAGYVLKGKLKSALDDGLVSSLKNYQKNPVDKENWDTIQENLKCCGVNSPADWTNLAGFENSTFPSTCCPDKPKACNTTVAGRYTEACESKIVSAVDSGVGVVAGAAIGIAVVELIGIILACCLANAIKKEYEVA